MGFKLPKNEKYQWTRHAQYKMRQYGLSAQRVIRVIRNPERMEEGIVPKTIAVMQPASIKYKNFKKTWSQEIWVMYQIKRSEKSEVRSKYNFSHPASPSRTTFSQREKGLIRRVKIISAWRYPGISPQNNPIPEEILKEIKSML